MSLFKSNVKKLEEKVASLEADAVKARQAVEATLSSAEAGGPVTAEDLARDRALLELAEARLRGAVRQLEEARAKAAADEREAEVRRLRASGLAAVEEAQKARQEVAEAGVRLMVAWGRNVAAAGRAEDAARQLGKLGASADGVAAAEVTEYGLAGLAHDVIRKDPDLSAKLGRFFSRDITGLGYFAEPEPRT